MTDRGTVLEAERLLVGYAGAPVCGEFSVSVSAGEVLGVVGFNGAGKSTAARTLAARQNPISGEVKVHGLLANPDAVPFRREVSAVFDEDLFFPSLTVREHLLLVARGHSLPQPEAVVEEELDFFGLNERADVVPEQLSSGQRRRTLLAAGLLRPASLLILDEPEQRLDPVMREALGHRIRTMAEDGCAVVLVTHDPQLLTSTATDCLVIDDEVTHSAPERGAAIIAGS
ncbi:ABC-type multidrug transport system ATPase subunit [Arthrobacter pigmenti]|uniref:ABC-type multidrug transport system ATPase subunit n=1 Tax=Arthrobacter pigmenti TaxID=271432 RepID=A0A846RTA6_9MICC|nr:ABC-type multidrug transport system ATPase subunit [Arthrobacter pigmenti]